MPRITRRSLISLTLSRILSARTRTPREVLAFYYGWYANPQISGHWAHWPQGTAHEPLMGRYDSHDPKVVQQALTLAKAAGITGLIVSWWGQGDFQDQGMPLILDTARSTGLKISIYYEGAKPRHAPNAQATEEEIAGILNRYGKHTAWLRVQDRPVIFLYSRAVNDLHLTGWAQVKKGLRRRNGQGVCLVGDEISTAAAKVFDGLHTYNPTAQTANKSVDQIRAWARATYPKWVATAGKRISSVTVIPGYDDRKLNRPGPRPTTSRHDGETYRVLWQEAVAAHPDWILITSWNEWHEGSEIEPSVENGDRELKTMREFPYASGL